MSDTIRSGCASVDDDSTPDISLILENLRRTQKHASIIIDVTKATIKALEVSRPIGYPTSIPRGQIWVLELLHGHPDRIRNELGVRKEVFRRLVGELLTQGWRDSEHVTVEEQLGIFLFTCATGSSSKVVGKRLHRSNSVITNCFIRVLNAFSSPPIYTKYVKLPRSDDPTPAYIADDPIMYPFFKDAIGAIDQMHVAWTPTEDLRRASHNTRHFYSQTCLMCCNFNFEFTYVISGWEGSVSDERVYHDARTTDFRIPAGKYYLADASFSIALQSLVPYHNIRYHLPEHWEHKWTRTNTHDYFNSCHAQLRNVAERTISLLKQRFRILVITPEFDIDIQPRIPAALGCIHNIIRRWDPKDMGGYEAEQAAPAPASTGLSNDSESPDVYGSLAKYWFTTQDDCDMMVENREEIANRLWQDHLDRLRSQGHGV